MILSNWLDQVHPSLSVTPNWHLLTPSNINLYTRKVWPLYLSVLWPLHTNAYMLYIISPWTSAELSGVYLVSYCKMENPSWHGGFLHYLLQSTLWRCLSPNPLKQDRAFPCLHTHPAPTALGLAMSYSPFDKPKIPPTTLQLEVYFSAPQAPNTYHAFWPIIV